MAEIKASDVKQLREKTGAGMMDCKKALTENNGDFEEAVTWLRKKGLAAASKKAGRTASEGLVGFKIQGNLGVAVELNSETDFVARNDRFQDLITGILDTAVIEKVSVEQMLSKKFMNGSLTVEQQITESVAIIGENMSLRRIDYAEVKNGAVIGYVHNAIDGNLGKIAVLVALESSANAEKLAEIGKKIAMHIAAMRPEVLDISDVNPENVQKEKDIFAEQAAKSGKPSNIIEKMVEGRVSKYYEEIVLLEQFFVMDNKIKIRDYVAKEAKDLGSDIKLASFVRYELGQGIEKQASNFEEEVKAMVK